jgi:hypothetical protein
MESPKTTYVAGLYAILLDNGETFKLWMTAGQVRALVAPSGAYAHLYRSLGIKALCLADQADMLFSK